MYVYSLREGIENGYLTPYRVRQFVSDKDSYTFDGIDEVVTGEVEDGTEFAEKDFYRIIQMRGRELHHVRAFLNEIKLTDKTIVFCATQAHAALIRDLINQEVRHADPDYCVRVTAKDGAAGEAFLERFQMNSRTILTTSQKLSTGVDAKNVRNIVLMRPIGSMIEFKQIIGRGTRTFEGKDYFTIYDFVKAHEKFDDPEWDGDPADIIVNPLTGPAEPGPQDEPCENDDAGDDEDEAPPSQMIEIKLADDHIVNIAATTFWGPDGKPLTAQEFIKRMFGELPDLFKDEDDLREPWSDPDTRKALMTSLAERGYDALVLLNIRDALDAADSDIFDVLAHIAYSRNMMSREHRAEVGRRRIEGEYSEAVATFLNFVLGHYVENGVEELDRSKLPDYLRLKFGTLREGADALGGMEAVASTYTGFQRHLYRPSN